MKALMSMVATAALALSGCAVSPSPASTSVNESSMAPAERKAALESQAHGIRTRIIQLKQQVVVQEVMLTNVERRAAMSQITLSNLPNTDVLSEPSPVAATAAERLEPNRLSVAVRPGPAAAPEAKPVVKKKKKKPVQKTSRPAPSRP